MEESKSCEYCNKTFFKRISTSKNEWAKQRFCSPECRYKSQIGVKHTPESNLKRSLALKGRPKPQGFGERSSIGVKHTPESNLKRSLALKGRPKPQGFGERISLAQKGQHHSSTTEFKKGHIHSAEAIQKMSESLKGRTTWNKGKTGIFKHSEEWKRQQGKISRERWANPNYKKAVLEKVHKKLITPENRERQRILREHIIIPAKDTKLEKKVQSLLDEQGIYYRKHEPIRGQPDIFIPPPEGYKEFTKGLALFIDGCAFHACPIHKKRAFKAMDDVEKQVHDVKVTSGLMDKGYHVMRVWEHDINDPDFDLLEHLNQIMPLQRVRA